VPAPGSPTLPGVHRDICQQFGEVPWDQNGDHLHYNALSLPLQNPEQGFSAQFVYTLSKANNEYDDRPERKQLALNPFNFRTDTDRRRPISGTALSSAGIFDPADYLPSLAGWKSL